MLAGGAPFPAVQGFGIAGINQAICGFPLPVAASCWSWDDWDMIVERGGGITIADIAKLQNLSKHAETFWQAMGNGNIVGNALTMAHNEWVPVNGLEALLASGKLGGKVTAVDMIKSSDSDFYTRLKYVYLTAAQWDELWALDPSAVNIWFIILV